MSNQFSRSELLLGIEAMKRIFNAKVAVFGLGGVGGNTAEALVRQGIKTIGLIDNDKVSISNLNRQIFATHTTIGMEKVDSAEQRLKEINPDINIKKYPLFYSRENADLIDLSEYDYIVDAIDTVTSKIELIERANKKGVKIISSMGAGNKLNPADFIVDDIYNTSVCPLARVLRHELKKRGIEKLKVVYSREAPHKSAQKNENENNDNNNSIRKQIPASNSFVPPVVGLIIASEIIKDIIKP